MDGGKSKLGKVHVPYKGVLTAGFYGFMSVSSVFINKAIFKVYAFNFPFTLVLGQTIFTLILLLTIRRLGFIRTAPFQFAIFKRVFLLSFAFLLKLLLDMSALALVNIPMYGVLKSSTTPCVLLLDYIMREKKASLRVQLAVYATTLGGLIAGAGDLSFHLPGYILALSSAMATAAYVVIVGKLGEELSIDSFTLLLYNNCWSLPFSLLLVLANGEGMAFFTFEHAGEPAFLFCFAASCASAFVLNWATYMCTLVNDSLTTSIVGRTKSILQGLGGLFAFGDVQVHPLNLFGLLVNSFGIGWYAFEKFMEGKRKSAALPMYTQLGQNGQETLSLHRDGSQLTLQLSPKPSSGKDKQQNGRV
ncbi:Nucleotide/sugar transporter family [Klebsormidium nitens]|uniref:Nucleotide/sugar transporter family n=1 Tax=Klebsormidium nitens TaxID=105231 RepID=A0A1Y1HVU5_KLENI|nr:Nucleotide/sugar transporter family [Klebsormidium nitens]|eukprot:GAQ81319.1 Nucleotide/sugar transporter family [Klebsormidium nitens]